MLRCSEPISKSLQVAFLHSWLVVKAEDNTQGPGIRGMVLFNFASREKYIVTILGNMMPIFAFYLKRPKVKPSLHQCLRTETR